MKEFVYPADLLGPGNDLSNMIRISLIGVEPSVIVSKGTSHTDISNASVGDRKGSNNTSGTSRTGSSTPHTLSVPSGTSDNNNDVEVTTTSSKSRTTHTAIWLPAPAVLNFSQAVNWSQGNLGGFNNLGDRKFTSIMSDLWNSRFRGKEALAHDALDLVKDVFAPAVNEASTLGSQELGNAIEYRTRSVRNPHAKVLFQGPNFRVFQFTFPIVPFEQADADTIREMTRALSTSAAPGYANRYNGFFGSDNWFSYPDEVEIEVMIKNPQTGEIVPNPFVQAIRRCVITSIDTTYGGQSVFTTHESGAPMDIQLSIQFMETEYLTKDNARILYQGEKAEDQGNR